MNETIKALRTQKGYSQSYLASYLEVSRQMYIKYENGEVEPPVRVIKLLCKLYGVTSDLIIQNKLTYDYLGSNHREVSYGDIMEKTLKVAEPEITSGYKPAANPVLEKLVEELKKMSQESLKAVMAFVKYLKHEKTESLEFSLDFDDDDNDDEEENPGPYFVSKEFFDMCGKVDFDTDAINELREASLI